jgi:hypothetical protein
MADIKAWLDKLPDNIPADHLSFLIQSPMPPTTAAPGQSLPSSASDQSPPDKNGRSTDPPPSKRIRPDSETNTAPTTHLSPSELATNGRRIAQPKNKPDTNVEFLERPIDCDPTKELPEDVRKLNARLRGLHVGKPFIPAFVREAIPSHMSDVSPYLFLPANDQPTPTPVGNPGTLEHWRSQIPQDMLELSALEDIWRNALENQRLKRHESAWNDSVHTPLLLLALGPQRDVRNENVTSASITQDAIPRLQKDMSTSRRPTGLPPHLDNNSDTASVLALSVCSEGSSNSSKSNPPFEKETTARGKKVDYAWILVPDRDSELGRAIESATKLHSGTIGTRNLSVNQTSYTPLVFNPIAISFESKPIDAKVDPLIQLGMWSAAWFRKMGLLWSQLPQDRQKLPWHTSLPFLPLVKMVGHVWEVYYAKYEDTQITIYGSEIIGTTKNMHELYRLLASLRILRDWVQKEVRQELEAWFTQLKPTSTTPPAAAKA